MLPRERDVMKENVTADLLYDFQKEHCAAHVKSGLCTLDLSNSNSKEILVL